MSFMQQMTGPRLSLEPEKTEETDEAEEKHMTIAAHIAERKPFDPSWIASKSRF